MNEFNGFYIVRSNLELAGTENMGAWDKFN